MKQLQAILFFDLDNTLVEIQNSHSFFDGIIVDVFRKQGILPPEMEERNKLWRDENFKELLSSWNYPDPVDFWKKFDEIDLIKRKKLLAEGSLALFDDVIPVLKKLSETRNIHVNLITNSSREITEFELTAFDLEQYFDTILALGDNQEDTKTNPNNFLDTLTSLSEKFLFSKDRLWNKERSAVMALDLVRRVFLGYV